MASFRHIEFKSVEFCHKISIIVLTYIALAYRIASKSDDILLKYGYITIFKMTIVRHLVFPNFQKISRLPIITLGHQTSSYKISRKSENPLLNYRQKPCFQRCPIFVKFCIRMHNPK